MAFTFRQHIQELEHLRALRAVRLSTVWWRTYRSARPQQETLTQRGSVCSSVWFVVKGRVNLIAGSGSTVSTVGASQMFGESALVEEPSPLASRCGRGLPVASSALRRLQKFVLSTPRTLKRPSARRAGKACDSTATGQGSDECKRILKGYGGDTLRA